MAILYSSSEGGLVNVIQQQFTPLSAYAFMIFILLYVPCISTVATIRKETTSWKWTLTALIYQFYSVYINICILSNNKTIYIRMMTMTLLINVIILLLFLVTLRIHYINSLIALLKENVVVVIQIVVVILMHLAS